MTEEKRNLVDDIVEGMRRLIEDLEHLFDPEKRQKRAPIPVPVRVRPDRREQQDRSYR